MATLPIKHMTLYKHGVGFFERRAQTSDSQVSLSFRISEMNDILKSLTAIDYGGGQVLGIDYATPQSRDEQLEGCSVRLSDDRSLRDLLASLRGRLVCLLIDQEDSVRGRLLGLDEPQEDQPLESVLVSVLVENAPEQNSAVHSYALKRLRGVEILDERGASDLRFFLDSALSQETFRQITIRLSHGEHDLSISYIAPAPTWRVSYRLVAEESGKVLLQGWGIFDNRLEEDLNEISLALVAGMPISFVYDLYTPHTPERPFIEEEDRVAAGPLDYEAGSYPEAMMMEEAAPPSPSFMKAAHPPMQASRSLAADLAQAAPVNVSAQDLGELFQYRIATPVSVRRGSSAMVPIIAAWLEAAYPHTASGGTARSLIYNGEKLPTHPVANLRLRNTSGLTLERGPVTVLADGEYVGEAVLPFTPSGGELIVPYAVELGIKVREENGSANQTRSVAVQGEFLFYETWDIQWKKYAAANTTSQTQTVLIEHPRSSHYEVYDTPDAVENAGEVSRFRLDVPAHGESSLRINERRLTSRREEIRRHSYSALQRLVNQGLIKPEVYDRLSGLLSLWEKIDQYRKLLAEVNTDREKVYRQQSQIQGNMNALNQEGKEGALRARYVRDLEKSEEKLLELERRENELSEAIKQAEVEIQQKIAAL